MKKTIILIINYFVLIFNSCIFADGYPKTLKERKAEELGSVIDGGISFNTSQKIKKISDNNTKNIHNNEDIKINKFLWQATIDVLDFVPLASVDSNGGIIITEWYIDDKNNTENYSKITVFIKDIAINNNSLEVNVFKRKLSNNQWIDLQKDLSLAYIIEEKILKRARELYINSLKTK